MTKTEVAKMMQAIAAKLGCKFTYRQWPEGSAPEPPYMLYYYESSDDLYADGINYVHITPIMIELYTNYKNPQIEDALEAELFSRGIAYSKSEDAIESERMYEVSYEMEEIING